MYWSWMIAKENYRRNTDSAPPTYEGMDIDWFWRNPNDTDFHPYADKYDVPSYVGAAMWMVEGFGLTRKPSSSCKLVTGKAVSLTMTDNKAVTVQGKDGKTYTIPKEKNLRCTQMIGLFESFGLKQCQDSDLPSPYHLMYFSDDGKWE